MSGRYAVNAATHFPDRVKAAASVYGVQLATDQPDSPHLAAGRPKPNSISPAPRPTSMRRMEIIEKVKAGMKGTNNEVEIYPGTASRLRLSETSGLSPRRRRAALGAAAGALSPQSRLTLVRCPSSHRLSRVRSDRHRDRAVRDPLVCAGLYRRHRAGLDLCARAAQEREAVGRAGADHAAAARRLRAVGHLGIILGGRTGYVLFYNLPFSSSTRPRSLNCGRAACRSTAASSVASPR